MKKLIILLLAFALALSLCGCKEDTHTGNNVPDNVVEPKQTTKPSDNVGQPSAPTDEPYVTELPSDEEDSSDTSYSDEAPDETEPSDKDDAEIIDDESGNKTDETVDVHQYKAFESIYLLNSDKVHAMFMEAISYDGEYITGAEREIYVMGDEFAYVTDKEHIIATHYDDVYVIDFANNVYCIYEGGFEEEQGDRFGYGIENYTPISTSEDGGVITEVFEIETYGGTITSTWTFFADGTFTVVDLIDESGAYYYYSFDVLEKSFSTDDMYRASALPAPNDLVLISVEEYEENY